MPHDAFNPRRAQLKPGLQPVETEFHDVLVIPPKRADGSAVTQPEEFYRFAVIKRDQASAAEEQANGKPPIKRRGNYYDEPELWNQRDTGQRKVFNIANPERDDGAGQQGQARGPAFAIMPVKPEPSASSCAFCYLVNAQDVLAPNAWTAEEWDAPGGDDLSAGPHANATEAEALLALPRGIVLRIKATGLENLDVLPNEVQPATVDHLGVTYEIEPVRLNNETEIWSQLRNGCIAGRVYHRKRNRVIPLLNLTSLMPGQAAQGDDQ